MGSHSRPDNVGRADAGHARTGFVNVPRRAKRAAGHVAAELWSETYFGKVAPASPGPVLFSTFWKRQTPDFLHARSDSFAEIVRGIAEKPSE